MSKSHRLVLFTSKSGNLARYVAVHFNKYHPIFIHPDDDIELVFKTLSDLAEQRMLIGMSVGYTKLIPKRIIDLFNKQLYNTHPAELPLTRGMYGAQAIYRMVETYRQVGTVTIHQIDEGYDTGPIILETKFPYLQSSVEMQLLYEYSYEGSNVPKDYLHEWIGEYTQMLKLVEPTIIVKFLQETFVKPKKVVTPRRYKQTAKNT